MLFRSWLADRRRAVPYCHRQIPVFSFLTPPERVPLVLEWERTKPSRKNAMRVRMAREERRWLADRRRAVPYCHRQIPVFSFLTPPERVPLVLERERTKPSRKNAMRVRMAREEKLPPLIESSTAHRRCCLYGSSIESRDRISWAQGGRHIRHIQNRACTGIIRTLLNLDLPRHQNP